MDNAYDYQQQQSDEERRSTACPKCDTRPVGERSIYRPERINGVLLYPLVKVCDECYSDVANASVERGIRAYQERYYTSTEWDCDTTGRPLNRRAEVQTKREERK